MQTKLVAAIVLGMAAAGLGAAVLVFSGGGKSADAPAVVKAQDPGPAPTQMIAQAGSGSDFMYDADPVQSGPGDDWQSRLEQFDWGEIQRMTPEQRRERMEAMRAEWEARMDKNGDGVVDEDERLDAMLASPMGRRLLDRFDANGDGMLDESERQAIRDEQARREAEREQRLIDRYDADGDGVLSDAERKAAAEDERRRQEERRAQQEQRMREMAAEFDRDGDGDLNADERSDAWQTLRERREIDGFIRQFDSNGDGQITTADLNAFLALYQAGDMKADINRDGSLDTLDINSFRDLMGRASNRP